MCVSLVIRRPLRCLGVPVRVKGLLLGVRPDHIASPVGPATPDRQRPKQFFQFFIYFIYFFFLFSLFWR